MTLLQRECRRGSDSKFDMVQHLRLHAGYALSTLQRDSNITCHYMPMRAHHLMKAQAGIWS